MQRGFHHNHHQANRKSKRKNTEMGQAADASGGKQMA
jgi:hypothetical protein